MSRGLKWFSIFIFIYLFIYFWTMLMSTLASVNPYQSTKRPSEPDGDDASRRQTDESRFPVVVSYPSTLERQYSHDSYKKNGVHQRHEDVLVRCPTLPNSSNLEKVK